MAVIDGVLGFGTSQFVDAENFDALLAAIEHTTRGWVVCHRSGRGDYPYRFDVNIVDGRSLIAVLPDIVQRLGVAIVVPDDGRVDPYAGLRFAPDATVKPFSLLIFDS